MPAKPTKRVQSRCRRGHSVKGENAYKRANGYIECRQCRELANRRLYERVQKKPLTMELLRSFSQAFWQRVLKSEGCWLWQGAPCSGYGCFRMSGYSIRPNRFALALKLRRLPKALACHTCDTPMCVRAKHLYEGTGKTNARDRGVRGRAARGQKHGARTTPWRIPRGTRNGNAKLDETKVDNIRKLYASRELRQVDIAQRFGITQPLVSAIVCNKIWKAPTS